VAERDIADVVLAALGYPLAADAAPVSTPAPPVTPAADGPSVAQGAYRPRATQPTPTLDALGRDLTRAALEGKLAPIVGRAEEIQLMIETLCRRTKRNPALVGPAGVGKTAIVEGLAQRIVAGQVPPALANCRIVALQPSHVVAGASMAGEFEERMRRIIAEASQDGLVLFIDEVHSLMGAGGRMGATDAASLLKPSLARGDLACIAATTDDEYRRYIEDDTALERRFQPIRIHELSAAETLPVLIALSDVHLQERGVRVNDDILLWLIEFSQRFMRNRYLPDKAVDLLDQCVAYAHTNGRQSVSLQDAMVVAQRMVGMPASIEDRLGALRAELANRVALPEEEMATLVNRLEVTVRGLDLRPSRPNAVVLLLDDAAEQAAALAEVIAETITGSPERVVTIDFSRFTDRWSLSMLLGAGPGYVGYEDTLPIHTVAQTPWCVLHCQNIELCYPAVLAVLAQALADGFFTDATGRRIYLSDTVVILTAAAGLAGADDDIGFGAGQGAHADATQRAARAAAAAREILGDALVDRCDVICARKVETTAAQRRWLETRLLQDLAVRYLKYGLSLEWEPEVVDWLAQAQATAGGWEKLVDDRLAPLLIPHLPAAGEPYATDGGESKVITPLVLQVRDGTIAVVERPAR
jgi:ATP-dependent Clp protease ATP-binding subunit ClpC